jgi:hypothetical protein
MIYLVSPGKPLRYSDLPFEPVAEAVRGGNNLSRIEWEGSERTLTRDVLRLTLRNGLAVPGGVIVRATDLVAESRPAELRRVFAETAEVRQRLRPQMQAHEDRLEAIAPGSKQHGQDLDAAVQAGLQASLREADEDLAEALQEPVIDELARHWVDLGGALPDPL